MVPTEAGLRVDGAEASGELVAVAKEEGILVWLFHGPRQSKKDGFSTFANELWQEADERYEINLDFMQRIQYTPTII